MNIIVMLGLLLGSWSNSTEYQYSRYDSWTCEQFLEYSIVEFKDAQNDIEFQIAALENNCGDMLIDQNPLWGWDVNPDLYNDTETNEANKDNDWWEYHKNVKRNG
jgi:hypothetical protein